MTDTEMRRREAICKVAGVSEIDDVSDGFHTFRQLYYQRMMLFAAIVRQNKDKAWKSFRHEDGELCFGGGWFIVGVDTPEGSYTYHYEDNYFSLFDCEELACGKHWDGHTEKDVTRLLSLPTIQPYTTTHDSIPAETGKNDEDRTSGDCISIQQAIDKFKPWLEVKGYNWGELNMLRAVINELENMPSTQPEQRWIPCSERLPEKEGWYITTVESEKTGKRRIENDLFAVDIALAHGHTPNKFCKDGYKQKTVAWMPFPEPYHGGEQ